MINFMSLLQEFEINSICSSDIMDFFYIDCILNPRQLYFVQPQVVSILSYQYNVCYFLHPSVIPL